MIIYAGGFFYSVQRNSAHINPHKTYYYLQSVEYYLLIYIFADQYNAHRDEHLACSDNDVSGGEEKPFFMIRHQSFKMSREVQNSSSANDESTIRCAYYCNYPYPLSFFLFQSEGFHCLDCQWYFAGCFIVFQELFIGIIYSCK